MLLPPGVHLLIDDCSAGFQGGVVVLVIGDVEDDFLHALGEVVLHQVHHLWLGKRGVLPEICADVDGLAYLHQHGGAESEEVAVFQTDRHYVQGQAAVHEFLGLECDPENAFGQWQQRVLCLMPPFGQYAEGYLVEQHVHALVDDLGVLAHLVHTVADAHDGHYLQETEDFRDFGIPENVGPGHEYFLFAVHGQNHQRVHQGVCMVRGVDDGSVGWYLFKSHVFYPAVCHPQHEVDVVPEEGVEPVEVLNFSVFLLTHCP